jgi:hypothetical protein
VAARATNGTTTFAVLSRAQVFREFQARKQQLLADVRTGIEQADQGLARPLDVDALIDRCSLKLAEEGILD